MKSYLKTEDLAVGYHGKPLIEEVSLCVQRGKIVTLIGPNGSGKSTILKTIIGQLPELSGAVYLDGERLFLCLPIRIAQFPLSDKPVPSASYQLTGLPKGIMIFLVNLTAWNAP